MTIVRDLQGRSRRNSVSAAGSRPRSSCHGGATGCAGRFFGSFAEVVPKGVGPLRAELIG